MFKREVILSSLFLESFRSPVLHTGLGISTRLTCLFLAYHPSAHVNKIHSAHCITSFSYNLVHNLSSCKNQQREIHSPILITFLLQISILSSTQNIRNAPAVSQSPFFVDCKFPRHVSVVLLCPVTMNTVILPTTFMIKMRFRRGNISGSAL